MLKIIYIYTTVVLLTFQNAIFHSWTSKFQSIWGGLFGYGYLMICYLEHFDNCKCSAPQVDFQNAQSKEVFRNPNFSESTGKSDLSLWPSNESSLSILNQLGNLKSPKIAHITCYKCLQSNKPEKLQIVFRIFRTPTPFGIFKYWMGY